jgi:hypothetical protein
MDIPLDLGPVGAAIEQHLDEYHFEVVENELTLDRLRRKNVERTVEVARRKDATSARASMRCSWEPSQVAGRVPATNAAFDLACLRNENGDRAILDALGLEVLRVLRAAVGFQVPAAELTNSRLFALGYQSPLSALFARGHT